MSQGDPWLFLGDRLRETDGYSRPELLSQSRRLPVGVPRTHQRSRVHTADRSGGVLGGVPAQPRVERVPRNPRPHLRPSLRAGLPPHPHRRPAGGDLPPQAGGRRPARRRSPTGCPRRPRRRTASGSPASARARRRSRWPTISRRSATRSPSSRSWPPPGGLMRSNIPSFRLPAAVLDEEIGMILGMGVEIRYNTPGQQPEGAAGRGLRRRLRRQRRAQGQGAGAPRPPGGRRQRPHRHRLARVGGLRAHRQDRRAGAHHRRGQHRHGLLPHLAPAGRQGHQGHGPPAARLLQGLPLGAGGRRGGAGRDHHQPRAQVVRRREAAS